MLPLWKLVKTNFLRLFKTGRRAQLMNRPNFYTNYTISAIIQAPKSLVGKADGPCFYMFNVQMDFVFHMNINKERGSMGDISVKIFHLVKSGWRINRVNPSCSWHKNLAEQNIHHLFSLIFPISKLKGLFYPLTFLLKEITAQPLQQLHVKILFFQFTD